MAERRKSWVMLVLLASIGCAASRADDATDALTQCRELFTNRFEFAQGEFERRDGVWQLVGSGLSSERVTDFDLDRLAELKTLEHIGLGGNRQTTAQGLRHLAALPHLRRLGIDGRGIYWSLTAADLQSIAALPHLEELILNYCVHLENEGLAHLKNLRRLDLTGLGLTDASMADLKSLSSLQALNLRRNPDITDAGVAELKSLVNLRELALGDSNKLTDISVTELKGLRNLQSLDIYRVGLVGLTAIKDLPHLEHLGIVVCESGHEVADLSVLAGLRSLSVNHVTGENPGQVRLPAGLRRLALGYSTAARLNLQSARHIEHVKVGLGRSVFGENENRGLEWLSSLPELRELTLVASNESDVIAVAGLTQLQALNIEGADCVESIGNEGMRALVKLQNLVSLKVEDYYGNDNDPQIVNAGMDVLPKLGNLQRLELHCLSAVTSKALANVWELKQLHVLELHLAGVHLDASLDGTLAGIEALSELEELSISIATRKILTDDGLKRLANLKKLRRLDLGMTVGYTDDALASLMKTLPNLQVVKRAYRPLADQGRNE